MPGGWLGGLWQHNTPWLPAPIVRARTPPWRVRWRIRWPRQRLCGPVWRWYWWSRCFWVVLGVMARRRLSGNNWGWRWLWRCLPLLLCVCHCGGAELFCGGRARSGAPRSRCKARMQVWISRTWLLPWTAKPGFCCAPARSHCGVTLGSCWCGHLVQSAGRIFGGSYTRQSLPKSSQFTRCDAYS